MEIGFDRGAHKYFSFFFLFAFGYECLSFMRHSIQLSQSLCDCRCVFHCNRWSLFFGTNLNCWFDRYLVNGACRVHLSWEITSIAGATVWWYDQSNLMFICVRALPENQSTWSFLKPNSNSLLMAVDVDDHVQNKMRASERTQKSEQTGRAKIETSKMCISIILCACNELSRYNTASMSVCYGRALVCFMLDRCGWWRSRMLPLIKTHSLAVVRLHELCACVCVRPRHADGNKIQNGFLCVNLQMSQRPFPRTLFIYFFSFHFCCCFTPLRIHIEKK